MGRSHSYMTQYDMARVGAGEEEGKDLQAGGL
jgi:hypothetical protein